LTTRESGCARWRQRAPPRRARSLSPRGSSPTMMLTLRVKSTVPSGKSSPLVSASAPSTRDAPKACCRISFFSGPFCMESAVSKCAWARLASAAAVAGVLVATISVPALARSAGSASTVTDVANSLRPRTLMPCSCSCCARRPRASIATWWPARVRWAPTIDPMAPAPSTANSNSAMRFLVSGARFTARRRCPASARGPQA